jgi:hypothetical protein
MAKLIMRTTEQFPLLEKGSIIETQQALHAYAGILGQWLKAFQPKRKHWWHASLRPTLNGLSTGVVQADVNFQIELNLRDSVLIACTAKGEEFKKQLNGQSSDELSDSIREFMIMTGVDKSRIPAQQLDQQLVQKIEFTGYSAEHADRIGRAINAVSSAMSVFRSHIKEETSPIQLWPHHFDVSMLWLPGEKIPGQDPDNEEYSDKQMNFGFAFGDEAIPEPYFYVTAYPTPEALPQLKLPLGTHWRTDGFNGAVLMYDTLAQQTDPQSYLIDLWQQLLIAGRDHMLEYPN